MERLQVASGDLAGIAFLNSSIGLGEGRTLEDHADEELIPVLSFMSQFSNRDSRSPTPTAAAPIPTRLQESFKYEPVRQEYSKPASPTGPSHSNAVPGDSPQTHAQRERAPSRPMSMVQTYQPPLMELTQDTLPGNTTSLVFPIQES